MSIDTQDLDYAGSLTADEVSNLLSESERLRSLLREVAGAPRSEAGHGEATVTAVLSTDLLERIGQATGASEMARGSAADAERPSASSASNRRLRG